MSEATAFIPPHVLNTPVLFLVFNRLDTTKQVFEAIRQAKPPRLYVAADGARANKEGEAGKAQAVRDYIMSNIDWECDVKTLFREENLGCKYAVSGAITWFFENEEQGIILEDDCLPSQSFFWFCEELLERYKDDMRIWHIGGASTLTNDIVINNDSYYFSNLNHIWGWAGWSNRWSKYDSSISQFPEFKDKKYIKDVFKEFLLQKFWINNLQNVYLKKIDTWDFQWCFTVWINRGVSITPTINMISNIGYGADATHTANKDSKMSNMLKKEMPLSLIHPSVIMINTEYDSFNFNFLYNLSYLRYFRNHTMQLVRNIIKPKSSKND